jgi:hypothetical protein
MLAAQKAVEADYRAHLREKNLIDAYADRLRTAGAKNVRVSRGGIEIAGGIRKPE